MFTTIRTIHLYILILAFSALFSAGCSIVKKESKTPTLLKTENATLAQLKGEVGRFARVDSLRAKMDLKFEDNSFAHFGSKEEYRSADGEIVVQRPANILLKVQVPVIKSDVAQMTSDGSSFRVAILQDGGSGKYKKFVRGSNRADYSRLQTTFADANGDEKVVESVTAFANMRPQHFTDAMLVRPVDDSKVYAHSTIFQIEESIDQPKKSPLRVVNRGYYLLDEFERSVSGEMKIARRFWFDRVGRIRLARQQLFNAAGEIESDILYGKEGNLAASGDYNNLPLQIIITRPLDKYSMRLTYQDPESVAIGRTYPQAAFLLENSWSLEEIDLDKRLAEATAGAGPIGTPPLTRVQ
ncbi:MAG: hypothetical protein H0V76_04285 [Blastocatellia bacterium]|nr:hypothetical protein [Blastocatellia bacterium]